MGHLCEREHATVCVQLPALPRSVSHVFPDKDEFLIPGLETAVNKHRMILGIKKIAQKHVCVAFTATLQSSQLILRICLSSLDDQFVFAISFLSFW